MFCAVNPCHQVFRLDQEIGESHDSRVGEFLLDSCNNHSRQVFKHVGKLQNDVALYVFLNVW
jgi:hypothetical protein